MKFLGVIPARAGSKRIIGKNMRDLNGKPLAQWIMETAKGSDLDHVLVTSDDDAVLSLAQRLGIEAVRRPVEMAQDTSDIVDAVMHAVSECGFPLEESDAVVLLQPTSPLTRLGDIDAACRLLESSGSESVVSVMEVEHHLHPSKFKKIIGNRLVPYLVDEHGTSSHQLEKVFVRNGSIYAARLAMVRSGRFFDDDSHPLVMPREFSIDINDEVDLAIAALLMK